MQINICSIGLLLLFCLFSPQITIAQTASTTIIGTVVDKNTQEPLAFVTVGIEGTSLGTATDARGGFSIEKLPAGTYKLVFNYLGYTQQKKENLRLEVAQVLDIGKIELTEGGITLKEMTVSPGSFSILGSPNPSRLTLSGEDIKNMSWGEDITRAVARLPGISSTDFSSKFTIRGGESDEVLMTLDGMELYDPFHQRDISGGLFSIVDIETVQGIELMTGGFSAEYGNRQSGVFNMKTKQIADNERHTSVGLSMMNARFYTDGKFAKNKGSYLFSARRGMLDFIMKAFHSGESIPYYSDGLLKVSYTLNDKHTLSFHTLRADDKTGRSDIYTSPNLINYDSSDIQYANTYAWLTLQSAYTSKLYSRTLLFGGLNAEDRYGSYEKDEYGDVGTFRLIDKRSFNFFGLKQDWSWELADRFILKGGFDVRQLEAKYDYFYSLKDIRINNYDSIVNSLIVVDVNAKPTSQQAGMYVSGRVQLLKSLFLETGLRYDYASHTKDKLWSPRISLAYAFSKKTFLRAAWGHYYQTQFINNLDVNHNASTFNKAELSKHYVLGLEHLFGNGISMRIEGYYKDMPRINPIYQNLRDPLEVFPEARNDVIKLNINGTMARGIELFLKYDMGKKVSWWFSYALAKAEDDVRSIEFDGALTPRKGKVPRTTGQRHTIYADVNFRPNKKWHLSLSGQVYTGWHRTNYHYNTRTMNDGRLLFYPVHEVFNATEYPVYHRVDLRVNRHFQMRKSRVSAFVHIINLYNQKNLRKYDLNATHLVTDELIPDGMGGYITPRGDKYWFGITPVVGASWEF